MDAYIDELQKITSFMEKNKDLVETALELVAISIMKTINDFNIFEEKVTTLVANYYKISYSPELDFKVDVPDSGYISYGQKLKILDAILRRNSFYENEGINNNYLNSLKTLGDLRNNIIHSVYGIDPSKIKDNTPKMIIYANGRKISEKDLMLTFSNFEKYHNQSNNRLNEIANFLSKKENENE